MTGVSIWTINAVITLLTAEAKAFDTFFAVSGFISPALLAIR